VGIAAVGCMEDIVDHKALVVALEAFPLVVALEAIPLAAAAAAAAAASEAVVVPIEIA
jgi:hypothetical protein